MDYNKWSGGEQAQPVEQVQPVEQAQPAEQVQPVEPHTRVVAQGVMPYCDQFVTVS